MKTKWEDLTVADVLKIREIGELQLLSDDEKNMQVASLLAGIPYGDMLMKPLDEVREIMDNTEFLLHPPVPGKAKSKYVLNGTTYTLFKDPSEMTVAQFIDYQQIYREGFDKMPAEMLSIFLVPKGHVYNDGYDKEQQLEDMLAMPITDALGVCDFFARRCLKSIERMRMFSMATIKVQRLLAPKSKKEMLKAMEIQLGLIMDELKELYGSLASKPSRT